MVVTPTDALYTALEALQRLDADTEPRGGAIQLRTEGGLARLLLCNSRAHNALTVRMMRQLAEAVLALHDFEGSAIIVASGHGGSFCAGGHLGQVRDTLIRPDIAPIMTRSMAVVLDALLDLPAVSVAVLEGAAIGGGAELITACDLRVARPSARVHFAQSALGVAAGWGGASRLVQHVGRASAVRLLAGALPFTAIEAAQIGLVQHVGDGSVDDLVRAVLGDLTTRGSSRAVRAVKRQVVGAGDAGAQAEAFLSVWGGPEHLAALNP